MYIHIVTYICVLYIHTYSYIHTYVRELYIRTYVHTCTVYPYIICTYLLYIPTYVHVYSVSTCVLIQVSAREQPEWLRASTVVSEEVMDDMPHTSQQDTPAVSQPPSALKSPESCEFVYMPCV